MIRVCDIILSIIGLCFLLPVFIAISIVGFFDTGSPLFIQRRVGKNQKIFYMFKFRTMKRCTASVASHLVDSDAVTPFGSFIRRWKLDELPQLLNVFMGDMSLVGPRPCLENQPFLIAERAQKKVFSVRPGITGLAQVRGVDMSTPSLLAEVDAEMINNFSIRLYFQLIVKTATGAGRGDCVS